MENNGRNVKQPTESSKKNNEEKNSSVKVTDSIFVNHAEMAWHERRKQWVGDQSLKSQRMSKDPIMSWTMTYEDLLSSTEPFHQPIPLAEMVDFLVDIWYEERFFD
ncbi:uncharacterized protein LOC131167940 [Malania oleifera]|uniref:uncharacterized protein LOC131167940 n=1 Tax=Malania oleifera TaxID=397392 RepID=UPI0025AEAB17|nr:uncharacterized protein LOC131167940 [Malania oleifera]